VTARVLVTERIRQGTVFLPMHWGAAQEQACEANRLMHALGCPISQQPELKAAAVTLQPVAVSSMAQPSAVGDASADRPPASP
jgi:ferredoxin-nitrate reductase